MNLIGIDIGSDSVRVSIRNKETGTFQDSERPLQRNQDGHKHTMSGQAVWTQIVSMMAEYDGAYLGLGEPERAVQQKDRSDKNENDTNDTTGTTDTKSLFSTRGVSPTDHKPEQVPPVGNQINPGQRTDLENKSTHKSPGPHRGTRVPASALCVAATCSMVVMQKTQSATGLWCYQPVEPGAEVIVWMDRRARRQAAWVARQLSAKALALIGGTVTPEMGIAKLKWVDDNWQNPHTSVCVFELYDWFSYVFVAGGYGADGSVRCLPHDRPRFAPGSSAMDGSVKGWGPDVLEQLQISAHVCCTPNTYARENAFPYVGTPLAKTGQIVVGHGCIDCYAGWAGVASGTSGAGSAADQNTDMASASAPSSCALLVVAGTSTCFVASVAPHRAQPVPGLWGPFSQLLTSPVYSFGQPATGQLFAELFAQHADIIGDRSPFVFVEEKAQQLEAEKGHALPVLARHYCYYGDKHGNRSPYGDFRMGEVFVDGGNAGSADTLQCAVFEKSVESLVLKYYLTVEFLVFQTKQLCAKVAGAAGPVRDVYLCGSQAQNARLVQMLASVAYPNSSLYIRHGAGSTYAGSQGIALALAPHVLRSDPKNIAESAQFSVEPGTDIGGTWTAVRDHCGALSHRATQILSAKYRAFEELAEWQSRFHAAMGEV